MFERAIEASEGLREAMRNSRGTLFPALCGCPTCKTVWMISSPVLGRCADCGGEVVETSPEPMPADAGRWFQLVPDAA